ncbi:hypothetical protein BC567DRAFT_67908 [Phyllosticta citribraziliensis]
MCKRWPIPVCVCYIFATRSAAQPRSSALFSLAFPVQHVRVFSKRTVSFALRPEICSGPWLHLSHQYSQFSNGLMPSERHGKRMLVEREMDTSTESEIAFAQHAYVHKMFSDRQ